MPANDQRPAASAPGSASASAIEVAAAKLLPRAVRLAWERAFVGYACDEINGAFDRIAALAATDAPCPPALRARIDLVVTAASWSDETVVAHLWELVKGGFERPEDAFGAATILLRLRPESKDALSFASALPPHVAQALRATGTTAGAGAPTEERPTGSRVT